MQARLWTAALLVPLVLGLSGCFTTKEKLWDRDLPETRLQQKQTDFMFEVEEPKANAMGCSGLEKCPAVLALLDERMKAQGYCRKGYSVLGWGRWQGQYYMHGPCAGG